MVRQRSLHFDKAGETLEDGEASPDVDGRFSILGVTAGVEVGETLEDGEALPDCLSSIVEDASSSDVGGLITITDAPVLTMQLIGVPLTWTITVGLFADEETWNT